MVFLLTSKACQAVTTSSCFSAKICLGSITPMLILTFATSKLAVIEANAAKIFGEKKINKGIFHSVGFGANL